ncbi:MAG: PD-(D/E)XK nuclease family transposase [Myxococcota bacterium]
MQRLDPKLDLVFKTLLSREPALLADMLRSILATPVCSVSIIDPALHVDIPPRAPAMLVIQIARHDHDDDPIEVFLEFRSTPATPANIINSVFTRDPLRFRRTVLIAWLLDTVSTSGDQFRFMFGMHERYNNMPFSDRWAIHVLQLSSFSPSEATGDPARVERWARFLLASSDAELDALASEDPIMALARTTLDQISAEPEIQALARARAEALGLDGVSPS